MSELYEPLPDDNFHPKLEFAMHTSHVIYRLNICFTEMTIVKPAVLTAPNEIALRMTEDPIPQPGDVLLGVRAATICGTDIRIYRGRKTAGIRYPSIVRHEFAGEVIDTGGHDSLKIGDRVGLCPYIACGKRHLCKNGMENLCTKVGS